MSKHVKTNGQWPMPMPQSQIYIYILYININIYIYIKMISEKHLGFHLLHGLQHNVSLVCLMGLEIV